MVPAKQCAAPVLLYLDFNCPMEYGSEMDEASIYQQQQSHS